MTVQYVDRYVEPDDDMESKEINRVKQLRDFFQDKMDDLKLIREINCSHPKVWDWQREYIFRTPYEQQTCARCGKIVAARLLLDYTYEEGTGKEWAESRIKHILLPKSCHNRSYPTKLNKEAQKLIDEANEDYRLNGTKNWMYKPLRLLSNESASLTQQNGVH
jgi:hypothetical protein